MEVNTDLARIFDFIGGPAFTVGVECEGCLINRSGPMRGKEAPKYHDVHQAVAAAARREMNRPDGHRNQRVLALADHLDKEVKPTSVELTSDAPDPAVAAGLSVGDHITAAAADIDTKIALLEQICTEAGLDIDFLPVGMHPTMVSRLIPTSPGPRLLEIEDLMGPTFRDQGVLGTHIHVGIPRDPTARDWPADPDGEILAAHARMTDLADGRYIGTSAGDMAVRAAEAIQAITPDAIALFASSPWLEEKDSLYDSVRTEIWGRMQLSGPLPMLHGRHQEYLGWLQLWCGLERCTSWKDFKPDVRLSGFQTVEGRAPDALPTRREREAAAAFTVAGAIAGALGPLPPELRRPDPMITVSNKFAASRFSLRSDSRAKFVTAISAERGTPAEMPIRDHVRRTLDVLMPIAREWGFAHHLAKCYEPLAVGNCAMRQRRWYSADLIDEAGRPLSDEARFGVVIDTLRWEQRHNELTLVPRPATHLARRDRAFVVPRERAGGSPGMPRTPFAGGFGVG